MVDQVIRKRKINVKKIISLLLEVNYVPKIKVEESCNYGMKIASMKANMPGMPQSRVKSSKMMLVSTCNLHASQ